MKKTLLSIFSVLTIGAIAQETNVVNRGFENWTPITINYPDTLASTAKEYLNRGGIIETNPVEQSSDAFEGASSIKISCIETADGDTLNGYAILGSWGDNGPSGGHPYTFQADSFSFHYKCDLQPNDTAWVILKLKKAGSEIGGGFYPIVGTQNTWTEYTAANLGSLLQPDSIFYAVISTNAIEDDSKARPGSWVMLDRFGMKKTNGDFKQVANGGYESWSDTTIYQLDDWYVSRYARSSDAHSGSYALELMTTARIDGDGDLDTNTGYVTNVPFDQNGNSGGTPYVLQPAAFSVWVEYEPSGADTANIYVNFYNNGSWVAGDGHEVTVATGGYSEVIMPFTFSMAPDSFRISVSSGDNPGSIIRLDDMDLTDNPTSATSVTINKFHVYPNPASEVLTINSEGSSYKIFNFLGSEIKSNMITNTQTQVSLSGVQNGLYFITVYNANNEIIGTQQFIVK